MSNTTTYMIIGKYMDHCHQEYSHKGWTRYPHFVEEKVATFDTKELAEAYIKQARLANPERQDRPFDKDSLLANFERVHIETYSPETWPHNPVIESKDDGNEQ